MSKSSLARRMLLPLVPLYRFGVALRESRLRAQPPRRLAWPVISIGNLSTGGAGKTPLVIALAQALTRRGVHVDVLSRGYGRSSQGARGVNPNGTAEDFGDEPLLIAREAGVPVYVAAERYNAGLLAEGAAFSGLHLLDDGFQHRQLARTIDILIFNRSDLHDHLLPAGNLREPLSAIRRAHVIAIPGDHLELQGDLKARGWTGPIWRLRRRMEVPPVAGPVVAFCGIARPEQFFEGLTAAGMHVASRIAFRDHHSYIEHDFDCLRDAARSVSAAALITTEKDRVRLRVLAAALPESLPLLTARLSVEIENTQESVDWLLFALKSQRADAI